MQIVNDRRYLGIADAGVDDVLRLAAKALAEAYGATYDPPEDLPDGWVGFRVDLEERHILAAPKRNACMELQRLLDLRGLK